MKDSVRPEKRRTLVVRLSPPDTLKQLFSEFGRVKEVRVSRLDAFVEFSTQEEMLRALRESTWLELDARPLRARPTAEAEARSARDGIAELLKRPEVTELRERWLNELSGWQREGLAEDEALWQAWLEHVPAASNPPHPRAPAAAVAVAPPSPVPRSDFAWLPPLKAGIIADKRRTLCVRSDATPAALRAFFARFGTVDEVTEGGAYKFVVIHDEADCLRAFYESTWTEFGGNPLWLGIPRAAEARGPNDVNWATFNVGPRRTRWLRALSGWQREALAEDQALWQAWLSHVPDDV